MNKKIMKYQQKIINQENLIDEYKNNLEEQINL